MGGEVRWVHEDDEWRARSVGEFRSTTHQILQLAEDRGLLEALARADPWPWKPVVCARCWKPVVGHGRRHSWTGILRQRAAQLRYDVGEWWRRIRGS